MEVSGQIHAPAALPPGNNNNNNNNNPLVLRPQINILHQPLMMSLMADEYGPLVG
jgi:hypothetical protein